MPPVVRIRSRPAGRAILIGALLAALAILPFLGALSNDFIGDDFGIVKGDPRVWNLSKALRFFTEPYWKDAVGPAPPAYRPVVQFTYALNHAVTGLRPGPFHAVNLLLHALVTLLLVRVALRAGASEGAAFWAGALFAVHAVHVEAVVSVVGRAELLAAAGVLSALLIHAPPDTPGAGASPDPAPRASWNPRRPLLAALLFLLGLGSKENAAAFLGLAPALDAARAMPRHEAGLALRRGLPAYALYAAAGVLYLLARHHAFASVLEHMEEMDYRIINPIYDAPTSVRVLTAIAVMSLATRLLLFPISLNAFYAALCIPPAHSILDARVLCGAGTIVLAIAALLFALRRGATVFFALMLVGLAYGPVSNLVVPIGWIFGERFLYLPSAGAAILAGLWFTGTAGRSPPVHGADARRVLALVLAGLAVALMAILTTHRVPDWHSDRTLMRAAIRVCPASLIAHGVLASTYMKSGSFDEAIRELTILRRLDPRNADYVTGLGECYRAKYQTDRAEVYYRQALLMDPAQLPAAQALGAVLLAQGKAEEASRIYLEALRASEEKARARLLREREMSRER